MPCMPSATSGRAAGTDSSTRCGLVRVVTTQVQPTRPASSSKRTASGRRRGDTSSAKAAPRGSPAMPTVWMRAPGVETTSSDRPGPHRSTRWINRTAGARGGGLTMAETECPSRSTTLPQATSGCSCRQPFKWFVPRATALAVNSLLTSSRYRVCSGGSVLTSAPTDGQPRTPRGPVHR